jgi:NAD+ diphosphatase
MTLSSRTPLFCPLCASSLEDRVIDGRTRRVCPKQECGFVLWDNPVPVVAAVVEHEGRVILVRQKGWPEKMLGLVTGFLERGETPQEGVLREVREELGLEGSVQALIGVYAFTEMNQVIMAFHVLAEGEIVLGPELDGFKAIPPAKLRPWPMGTGLAVRDWLEKRGV